MILRIFCVAVQIIILKEKIIKNKESFHMISLTNSEVILALFSKF